VTTGTVLNLADITPVSGPDAALSARICAAINLLEPEPPLVIVAEGALALLLPAVALSQRSSRRRVAEYVLLDPELPPVTDGWPDAPVTVLSSDNSSDASIQGRLRGWTVRVRFSEG
jgi:hypothetical protein